MYNYEGECVHGTIANCLELGGVATITAKMCQGVSSAYPSAEHLFTTTATKHSWAKLEPRNVSDKKVSKALTLFNGHAQSYRGWSDRMNDHCKEVNCCYDGIFEIMEAQKTRMSSVNLTMGQLEDGTVVDYRWFISICGHSLLRASAMFFMVEGWF